MRTPYKAKPGYARATDVAEKLEHSAGHSLKLMREGNIPSVMIDGHRYCKEQDLQDYYDAREAIYAEYAHWITTRQIAETLGMKLQTCAYKLFYLKKSGKVVGEMGVHRLTDKIFYNTYFWPPETVDVLRESNGSGYTPRKRRKTAPDWFAIPFADGERKRQAELRRDWRKAKPMNQEPGDCDCGQPARIAGTSGECCLR